MHILVISCRTSSRNISIDYNLNSICGHGEEVMNKKKLMKLIKSLANELYDAEIDDGEDAYEIRGTRVINLPDSEPFIELKLVCLTEPYDISYLLLKVL